METHAAADFAERTVVERVDSSSEEPGKYGVVVRRDHKMVRVDFSMSGGKASQWVGYTDLRIVDDVLNLSNASDCPSDPGSGGGGSSAGCKQVLTISDMNNARFCKRCNEGFELLTKDTCCPGGHPNYLWTKDVPDHINLIQVTSASSHPARTVPPQDASSGVGLAPVMEEPAEACCCTVHYDGFPLEQLSSFTERAWETLKQARDGWLVNADAMARKITRYTGDVAALPSHAGYYHFSCYRRFTDEIDKIRLDHADKRCSTRSLEVQPQPAKRLR